MAVYTKQFLVDAFIHRYKEIKHTMSDPSWDNFVKMANDFYDKVGKDEFRKYASLDAEAIRKFKLAR